jgi:hypothetical protein
MTPQAVAEAVNRFDPARLKTFKANARAASRQLNAKVECEPLLAEFRRVVEAETRTRSHVH